MDAFSPIRKGKIQEVRNKIFGKLYDTKGLREKTANKLVQSGDIRNLAYDFSSAKRQKSKTRSDSSTTGRGKLKIDLDIRTEKVKEAKDKRQRGYYNNPEVFSKIAQRFVDLLGI